MTPDRTFARALIAWVFIHGGAATLHDSAPRTLAASSFLNKLRMAAPILPDDTTLVRMNAAAQVAAGAFLAAGACEKHAARLLAASLIPTTIAGHPFWAAADPASEAIQFGKNLGILGALILLSGIRTPGSRRQQRPG